MLIFTIATMAAVRGILLFVLKLDGVLSLQCPSQKSAEVFSYIWSWHCRILQDNGVTNFKILEANTDRIGGRIRNASFGGVQIELGAQWVEECPENMTTLRGPKVNPIWTLIRDPTKCFVEGIRQFNGCYTDEYEFMDCISTGQCKIINIDSLYEEFEEIFHSVFLKMAQMFLLL